MNKQKELYVYSEITQQTFLAFINTYGYIIEGLYSCPVFGYEVHFSFTEGEFIQMFQTGKFTIIGEV